VASTNFQDQNVEKSTPNKPEGPFTTYEERIGSYKYSTTNSAFAQHLLDNGHSFGPNEEIIGTLHFAKKGRFMNNFENSYTGLFISPSGNSGPCGTVAGMVTPKGSMSTEGETLQVSVLP